MDRIRSIILQFMTRKLRRSNLTRPLFVTALIATLWVGSSHAQLALVEWEKRQNAEERLQPFGDDLFGDQIDPHTGTISVFQTDVSIPGNSGLDVSLMRRRSQGALYGTIVDAEFGDWEYIVPRIKVTTHFRAPWTGQRCTKTFTQQFPTVASNTQGQFFQSWEYTNGVTVEVGGTQEQMLEAPRGNQWPVGTKYVTQSGWQLACGSATDGGQGFIGKDTAGNTYRFDRVIVRQAEDLRNYGAIRNDRRDTYIVAATEVTDVNGNWVRYDYNANGQLTQILSNDGRAITLTYTAGSNLVRSVSANGRTWTYSYEYATVYWPYTLSDDAGDHWDGQILKRVTLPDNRFWEFDLKELTARPAPSRNCIMDIDEPGVDFGPSAWIVHPSGAKAEFTIRNTPHRYLFSQALRQPQNCVQGVDPGDPNPNPVFPLVDAVDTILMSVTKKKVTGPSIPTAEWTYQYEKDVTSGTSASDPTNWTKVQGPGVHITYFHRWTSYPEGVALARKEVRAAATGAVLEQEDHTYLTEGPIGTKAAHTNIQPGNSSTPRRTAEVLITRGSDWFKTVNTFGTDLNSPLYSYGNPTRAVQTSSLTTPGKTTDTVYLHNRTLWRLALPQSVTVNNIAVNAYGYDSLARRISEDLYGARIANFAYHTTAPYAGMVHWIEDALGRRHYALNWKRGAPQEIVRPDDTPGTLTDNTRILQAIDNNGWVTSITDPRGIVTNFVRDNMGRLTQYSPVGWSPTNLTYSFSAAGAVQTITRANARTTITYDNMWRPTLVRSQDLSTTWSSWVRSEYDARGREVFTSFPASVAAPATGTTKSYDALSRIVQAQENVAPFATTTTEYITGNKVRVTDPAGHITTSTRSAYGSPDNGYLTHIDQPLGISTVMTYDIFGNLLSAVQGAGATTATQAWAYDSRYRVCAQVTPETGTKRFEYDAASQLIAYAEGLTGSACAVLPAEKTALTYDSLGRNTLVNYPGTTPDISKAYDNNGNVTSVNRGGVNWTYQYNTLNALSLERLQLDGRTYEFSYSYTPAGFLAGATLPFSTSVAFSPDGLGRPTGLVVQGNQIASLGSYFPNGAPQQMAYGNGYVYTAVQDARQLITSAQAISGSVNAIKRNYGYDAFRRVTAITDQAVTGENRAFTYDGLGRLATASGPWGAGSYSYDPHGNLTSWTEGSSTHTTIWDTAKNRPSSATTTGLGTRAITYDARGNTTGLGGLGFTYDDANQPVAVSGAASGAYVYDGNLKRVKQTVSGQTIYSAYSTLTGRIAVRDNAATGERNAIIDLGPASVRWNPSTGAEITHLDHLGSPVAATSWQGALLWRESYTPYGDKRLDPAANRDKPSFTGHIDDAATGLVYMQARYYDPVLGRFLANDPVMFTPQRPDMFNRYAYAANDPVNATDPDGEQRRPIPRSRPIDPSTGRPASTAQIIRSAQGDRNLDMIQRMTGEAQFRTPAGSVRSRFQNDQIQRARDSVESRTKSELGIPQGFTARPSDRGGGVKFTNPNNRHDSVRLMPGNSGSPNAAQQEPYIVQLRDGQAVLPNGMTTSPRSPEAHIPRAGFQYQPPPTGTRIRKE